MVLNNSSSKCVIVFIFVFSSVSLHQKIVNDCIWTVELSCFFKWAIPGLFSLIFVFSIQLTLNKCSNFFCQWLDLNRGPLVMEATALPTEPQPLPRSFRVWSDHLASTTTTGQLITELFKKRETAAKEREICFRGWTEKEKRKKSVSFVFDSRLGTEKSVNFQFLCFVVVVSVTRCWSKKVAQMFQKVTKIISNAILA